MGLCSIGSHHPFNSPLTPEWLIVIWRKQAPLGTTSVGWQPRGEGRGGVVADWLQVSAESFKQRYGGGIAGEGGARRRVRPLILVVASVYGSYCMWGEQAN